MARSPWRTAIIASSSWSHSFPTEKNRQLWPDVAADRKLFDALENGDYAVWHRYTTDDIEDSGQHEVLNWFCLLGAMEELGRDPIAPLSSRAGPSSRRSSSPTTCPRRGWRRGLIAIAAKPIL
jgi:hypothetical protein